MSNPSRRNIKSRNNISYALEKDYGKLFYKYKKYEKLPYKRILDRDEDSNKFLIKMMFIGTGVLGFVTSVLSFPIYYIGEMLKNGSDMTISNFEALLNGQIIMEDVFKKSIFLTLSGVATSIGTLSISITHSFLNKLKDDFYEKNKKLIEEEFVILDYLNDYDSEKNDYGLNVTREYVRSVSINGNSFEVNKKLFLLLAKYRNNYLEFQKGFIDGEKLIKRNKIIITDIMKLKKSDGVSSTYKEDIISEDQLYDKLLNIIEYDDYSGNFYISIPEETKIIGGSR